MIGAVVVLFAYRRISGPPVSRHRRRGLAWNTQRNLLKMSTVIGARSL